MFAQNRIAVLSVVALIAVSVWAISCLVNREAEAAPIPAGKAARDLERAEREWRDQERHHAEEMVMARLDLFKSEEDLRTREEEWGSSKSDLRFTNKQINYLKPELVPQGLRDKAHVLSAKEQKLHDEAFKAREKVIAAEEKVRQLGRTQALTRDRIRARIEAAEDSLRSKQGLPHRNTSTELMHRLQDMEQNLERLRREVAELRKQLQHKKP